MATYGNNTTIAISGAINITTGSYTIPANSYAIVNAFAPIGNGSVLFGSLSLSFSSDRFSGWPTVNDQSFYVTGLYVGPGQVIQLLPASGSSVRVNGVLFTNTP
jgi:hypothetical protein